MVKDLSAFLIYSNALLNPSALSDCSSLMSSPPFQQPLQPGSLPNGLANHLCGFFLPEVTSSPELLHSSPPLCQNDLDLDTLLAPIIPLSTPVLSSSGRSFSSLSEPSRPKGKPGRKPKPRPSDADELLREIEDKRRRNTESARRARVRKVERMECLEKQIAELLQHNKAMERQAKMYQDRIASLENQLRVSTQL